MRHRITEIVEIINPAHTASVFSRFQIAQETRVFRILPFSHPDWEKSIEESLGKLGKYPCWIRSPEGGEIITIYSSLEYSQTCHL